MTDVEPAACARHSRAGLRYGSDLTDAERQLGAAGTAANLLAAADAAARGLLLGWGRTSRSILDRQPSLAAGMGLRDNEKHADRYLSIEAPSEGHNEVWDGDAPPQKLTSDPLSVAGARPLRDHLPWGRERPMMAQGQIRLSGAAGTASGQKSARSFTAMACMAACEEISRRKVRDRLLPSELFSDPAWDLLLELLLIAGPAPKLSVSDACVRIKAPASTALRHLNKLVNRGLVVRTGDPLDGRRSFVRLTDETREIMLKLFGYRAPSLSRGGKG